ncbi:LPXTG cell wall anchor domain-containing protein [Amycolatopsis sp. NPDC006131]|uniref:LPXTG cell wall anchor domain-containing protein n=1 Tax=Amycolatopsis sp. NPDC006131 TaxID=3156731 RepID=UPI0033BF74FC
MKKLLTTVAAAAAVLLVPGVAHADTVTVTDKSGVDFSQTRATGHWDFTPDGLHVWTDSATSTDKVAAYLPVTAPLASAASAGAALEWEGTSPAPGYQLAGTWDGHSFILVGETVYGGKWWVSDAYCGTWCAELDVPWSGGGGAAHSATLAQWSTAMPGAQITAIGFSLGSGVKGDGLVKSLTYGNTVYRFTLATDTTTTTTTVPSDTTTTTTGSGDENTPTTVSTNPGDDTETSNTTGGAGAGVVTTTTTSSALPVAGDSPDRLAYTGASSALPWLLTGGGLLLLGGGALLFLTRRRRSS